jgi:fatty-acyl-CoA synthase
MQEGREKALPAFLHSLGISPAEEEPMQGLMMQTPLTLQLILERARRLFPRKEIATRGAEGMHRTTYAELCVRVARLASALGGLGVGRGTRVATFAWNSHRHLELYFGVPCMGAVLHTLNLRLPPAEIAYIVNHAADEVLFVDESLLPLLEPIAPELRTVREFVVLGDGPLPSTRLSPVRRYEDLLALGSPEIAWPELAEEEAAAICYTTGTTGNPKGVLYSHRALVLHAMAECMADTFAIQESDAILPVVPMFHAMCWGLPYAATLVGSKQVFLGPHLQPRDIAETIQAERVTVAAGVPTIWLGLFAFLERERYDLSSVRIMPVGGSAVPRALIERAERELGLHIMQAWGMTEMTPLGSVSRLKSEMLRLPESERLDARAKQGLPVPGVEVRAVDVSGREIVWDGKAMGELQVRGPWVARAYYEDPRTADAFADGWFRTGDVVTIDPEGFLQIVDRTKDLVKSGGEWISSVDLENAIMACPKVQEAAVIAVAHPFWQERPLACVVAKPEFKESLQETEIYALLSERFAKWSLPDAIVFLEAIPKTSVGKFDKKVLRERFKGFELPSK